MAFPFEGSSLLDRGPAAGVAEPTWGTWTFVAGADLAPGGWNLGNIIIDDNGVAWMDEGIAWDRIHTFDTAGVHNMYVNHLHSTLWEPGAWCSFHIHHSILYRYILCQDAPSPVTISVIRDYAVIFSRNITLDFAGCTDIYYFAMSPNGRYIGIIARRAGQTATILIYEGS